MTNLLIISGEDETEEKLTALLQQHGFSVASAPVDSLLEVTEEINQERKGIYEVDDMIVNVNTKVVHLYDEEIDMAPTEFDLLVFLVKNKDRVLNRKEIITGVWGEGGVEPHTVSTYIGYLRTWIDKPYGTKRIKTKKGYGYYLDSSKQDPILI